MSQSATRWAYVAALAPVIFGTTYLLTTQFLPPGRPLLAALMRSLPTGVVLVALTRTWPPRGWWGRLAVLSILYCSAFFPLHFIAAYRLPGGVASVINSITPLIVVVLYRRFDLGSLLTLENLKASRDALAGAYRAQPALTLVSFFALYVLAVALSIPGATVLTLAAGAMFGLGVGLLVVSFASSLGALLAFLAARYLLRDTVQSRFGRAKWLEPATDRLLAELPTRGVTRVALVAPGFAADCLETLEELAIRGRTTFLAAGGSDFAYLPCLNDSAPGMTMLRSLIGRELEGWLPAQ